jgi:hypothetical protein
MIVYAIDLWARRHLRPPTAGQWDRAGEDHPSRQTVQRVFGSWNAAIQAAGYVPRRPGRPFGRRLLAPQRRRATAKA